MTTLTTATSRTKAANSFAAARQSFEQISAAFRAWPEPEQSPLSKDEHHAGWDALATARSEAIDTIGITPATTIADIAAKVNFIATLPDYEDVIDPWALTTIRALAKDLTNFIDRPTRDAFALKLATYERAIAERAAFELENKPSADDHDAYTAYEEGLDPHHDAVHACAKAVLLQPAPDTGAISEKRRIFETEQFWHVGDDIADIVRVMLDDAIALAA